jgi:hypothetical protein
MTLGTALRVFKLRTVRKSMGYVRNRSGAALSSYGNPPPPDKERKGQEAEDVT